MQIFRKISQFATQKRQKPRMNLTPAFETAQNT